MSVRQLFDFVTSLNIEEEDIDSYLERIQAEIEDPSTTTDQQNLKQDEEVFKKAYIPRNLFEVIDIEKDIDKIMAGDTKEVVFLHQFMFLRHSEQHFPFL